MLNPMNKKHSRILNALSLEMVCLIVLLLMPEFAYLLTQGFNKISKKIDIKGMVGIDLR